MTQIKIGNQTAFITSPFEPFDYALSQGFTAFEWFPDKKDSGLGWLVYDIDDRTRMYIKDTAAMHNIVLSVHASTVSYPYSSEGVDMLWKDIHFAEYIKARVFNIHFYKEQGIETFAATIMPLMEHLGQRGIKLAIENTPQIFPHDFKQLFDILRDKGVFSMNNAGICLDLGHANLCESTRNNYIKYIDELDDSVPIIHMHVHENYGEYDSHLPLFTGPSGQNDGGIRTLIKRLKQRSFNGSLILEQWPDPPSLLNQARDRLMWLINDIKVENPEKNNREPMMTKVVTEPVKETHESLKISPLTEHSLKKPINRVRKYNYHVTSDEFVKKLIQIDEACRSWREKLVSICQLFEDKSSPVTSDQLVYLAIYLRFIGTGEILCLEDGRHYRPNHHAQLSQKIQERLAALTTPDNALVIRKIYPWLPSFDSDFMRSEPLTRIRDIAHRNDIPKELKKEIKHRLQNKLHRCAGPEDLVTSESILRRITAPGADYSQSFVEQFKIFHKELREFFSASSVDEWLNSLIKSEDTPLSDLARRFLTAKKKTKEDSEHYVMLLKLLTELRNQIQSLANNNSVDARAQRLRLADIGLEDYAFVLLSKMINQLESFKEEVRWKLALYCLALTVENLRLSGVSHKQCRAIEGALHQWYDSFDSSDHTQLLITKATLDRCLLLTEEYSNRVISLFFEKVNILGPSLGVSEHAIGVYCESDIRGNLIFQLSKLASWLLKKIRKTADLPPWDIIVPGTANGSVVIAESLPELRDMLEPCILILRKAEGDEELPKYVTGLILCHELPHLSHLAVRARQKGVVLITCEDENLLSIIEEHAGSFLTLEATVDGVNVKTGALKFIDKKTEEKQKTLSLPDSDLNVPERVLNLKEVNISNCGGKAYGAQRLYELSAHDNAGFKTPQSVALPFSVMKKTLERIPAVKAQYDELTQTLSNPEHCHEENLKRMSELIEMLPFDNKIKKSVEGIFHDNTHLMVRSSANCEDLAELAGAGLYSSVANVTPCELEKAVKTVWASLWSRRAVLSRNNSGVSHRHIHMGVLIQEMITPDYSFIIHTVNPISGNPDECYIELAVGLGETMASGATRGAPYRMVCNKETGELKMLAFASFNHALWPDREKGTSMTIIDYSCIPLTTDALFRRRTGKNLAQISRFVETKCGKPQDIEGVIVGDEIYLVQTRVQQGKGAS